MMTKENNVVHIRAGLDEWCRAHGIPEARERWQARATAAEKRAKDQELLLLELFDRLEAPDREFVDQDGQIYVKATVPVELFGRLRKAVDQIPAPFWGAGI